MTPSYRFGKGPIVVKLEAALSKRETFDQLFDDLVKALKQMAETADGEPTFVSSFKQNLGAEDRKHLQQDVFGEAATDSVVVAQGKERRLVYYEGLKRAMELARKLGTPQAPAPIEIFWGCGQRVNECWISWDKTGGTGITLFVLSKVPATGDQRAPGVVVPSFPPADPKEKGLYVVRPAQATGVEVNEARPDIGV